MYCHNNTAEIACCYIIIYNKNTKFKMPTLYYTDYSSPSVYQQRVVAAFCNSNITLHQISHKTSPVVFIDEGVVLY